MKSGEGHLSCNPNMRMSASAKVEMSSCVDSLSSRGGQHGVQRRGLHAFGEILLIEALRAKGREPVLGLLRGEKTFPPDLPGIVLNAGHEALAGAREVPKDIQRHLRHADYFFWSERKWRQRKVTGDILTDYPCRRIPDQMKTALAIKDALLIALSHIPPRMLLDRSVTLQACPDGVIVTMSPPLLDVDHANHPYKV